VIEDFRYIPRARIEKETENVKRKRQEEEAALGELRYAKRALYHP